METTVEMDFTPHVLIALGTNSLIKEDIAAIYREKPYEYFLAYEMSEWSTSPLFDRFTIDHFEQIRQIASIFEYEAERYDNPPLILRLIKKGFRQTYLYFTNTLRPTLDGLIKRLRKKKGEIPTDLEFSANATIFYYLMGVHGKKFEVDLDTPLGRMYANSLGRYEMYLDHEWLDDGNDEVPASHDDEVDMLRKAFGLEKETSYRLEDIWGNALMKSKQDLVQRFPGKPGDQLKQIATQTGDGSYVGSLVSLIRMLGFFESDVAAVSTFSSNDIDMLAVQTVAAQVYYQIPKHSEHLYFLAAATMLALTKEYRKVRERYLLQTPEKFEGKLKEIEGNAAQELEILNEKLAAKVKELILTQEQLLIEQKERERLAIENRRLQAMLAEQQDHSNELEALRSYFFNSIQETEGNFPEEQGEDLVPFLQEKSIAIVGGHPNWVKKLKEVLPNLVHIDTDELGRNLSFLVRMDATFLATSYLSHGMYYKVMTLFNGENKQVHFLNTISNLQYTLSQIKKGIH